MTNTIYVILGIIVSSGIIFGFGYKLSTWRINGVVRKPECETYRTEIKEEFTGAKKERKQIYQSIDKLNKSHSKVCGFIDALKETGFFKKED